MPAEPQQHLGPGLAQQTPRGGELLLGHAGSGVVHEQVDRAVRPWLAGHLDGGGGAARVVEQRGQEVGKALDGFPADHDFGDLGEAHPLGDTSPCARGPHQVGQARRPPCGREPTACEDRVVGGGEQDRRRTSGAGVSCCHVVRFVRARYVRRPGRVRAVGEVCDHGTQGGHVLPLFALRDRPDLLHPHARLLARGLDAERDGGGHPGKHPV
nr:hypothetical protein [Streptomyces sp. SA3_actF]